MPIQYFQNVQQTDARYIESLFYLGHSFYQNKEYNKAINIFQQVEVKKDIRYTDIPVIFISELSDIIDEFRAFELGAVDYIRKPIIPSILLSRVNSQITLNDTITRLKKYILILEGNTPDKRINVDKLTHYGEDNQFDKSIHYDKFKDMIMFVVSELAEGVGDGKKHHQNARTQKLVEIIDQSLLLVLVL